MKQAEIQFSWFDHRDQHGKKVIRVRTRRQQTGKPDFTPPMTYFAYINTVKIEKGILQTIAQNTESDMLATRYRPMIKHKNNVSSIQPNGR